MQLKKQCARNPSPVRRHTTLLPRLSLLAACIMPSLGYSLGLGDLQSQSHLGEPLVAKINLVNVPDDADESNIRIRQVYRDEAKSLGMDLVTNWQPLEFHLVIGEQSQIQLVSRKPVREPYMNILVELRWPKGKIYREYTLLLDPPPLTTAQALPRVITVPRSAYQPHSKVAAQPHKASAMISGDQYQVVRGDSLNTIARRVAESRGGNVSDWADTLFRNNTQAFVNGDRNRLLAGHTLVVTAMEHIAEAPQTPLAVAQQTADVTSDIVTTSVDTQTQTQPLTVAVTTEKMRQTHSELERLNAQITEQNQRIAELEKLLRSQTRIAAPASAPQPVAAPLPLLDAQNTATTAPAADTEVIFSQATMGLTLAPTLQSLQYMAAEIGKGNKWLWLLGALGLSSLLSLLRFTHRKHVIITTAQQTKPETNVALVRNFNLQQRDPLAMEEQEAPTFATATKPEPPEIARVKDAIVRQHIKQKMVMYQMTKGTACNDTHMVEELTFAPDLAAKLKLR